MLSIADLTPKVEAVSSTSVRVTFPALEDQHDSIASYTIHASCDIGSPDPLEITANGASEYEAIVSNLRSGERHRFWVNILYQSGAKKTSKKVRHIPGVSSGAVGSLMAAFERGSESNNKPGGRSFSSSPTVKRLKSVGGGGAIQDERKTGLDLKDDSAATNFTVPQVRETVGAIDLPVLEDTALISPTVPKLETPTSTPTSTPSPPSDPVAPVPQTTESSTSKQPIQTTKTGPNTEVEPKSESISKVKQEPNSYDSTKSEPSPKSEQDPSTTTQAWVKPAQNSSTLEIEFQKPSSADLPVLEDTARISPTVPKLQTPTSTPTSTPSPPSDPVTSVPQTTESSPSKQPIQTTKTGPNTEVEPKSESISKAKKEPNSYDSTKSEPSPKSEQDPSTTTQAWVKPAQNSSTLEIVSQKPSSAETEVVTKEEMKEVSELESATNSGADPQESKPQVESPPESKQDAGSDKTEKDEQKTETKKRTKNSNRKVMFSDVHVNMYKLTCDGISGVPDSGAFNLALGTLVVKNEYLGTVDKLEEQKPERKICQKLTEEQRQERIPDADFVESNKKELNKIRDYRQKSSCCICKPPSKMQVFEVRAALNEAGVIGFGPKKQLVNRLKDFLGGDICCTDKRLCTCVADGVGCYIVSDAFCQCGDVASGPRLKCKNNEGRYRYVDVRREFVGTEWTA